MMRASARVGDCTCMRTLTHNYTHTHTRLRTHTPIIFSAPASSGQNPPVRLLNCNENSENYLLINPSIICIFHSFAPVLAVSKDISFLAKNFKFICPLE